MFEQIGIFTLSDREMQLSKLGDSLEKLNLAIDWEAFRPLLDDALKRSTREKGGRKPYDAVLMFKILVLQRIYNLSDDQTEYQITDRISFMRFLGLGLTSTVPDAKTIWLFRETLAKANAAEKLFRLFAETLERRGLIAHTGSIVDASFVDAPKHHLPQKEADEIKQGQVPEILRGEENKHKRSQTDLDGRFGRKYGETHFGYKLHVKADVSSKFVTKYTVTPANVEDNRELVGLLDEKDTLLYADKGYVGKNFEEQFPENVTSMILEKAQKNRPLSEAQKALNREKSSVRARVEHIFGYMTKALHGMTIRSKGMSRARFGIGLLSVVYNMERYTFLSGKAAIKG